MAEPGWYPDPEAPDRKRHWDGESWAKATRKRRRWPLGVASLLAATMIVALLLLPGTAPAPDGDSADTPVARPTITPWPELLPPADDDAAAQEAALAGDPTDCPVVDEQRSSHNQPGFVTGGGLTFPTPTEWAAYREVAQSLTDEQSVERRFGGTSLRSTMTVGKVMRADGFMTPQEAATGVLDCHINSSRFPSNNMGVEVLTEGATTVDGAEAWALTVHVKSIRSGAHATRIDVVAVDTGDDDYIGIYLAVAMEAGLLAADDVSTAIQGLSLA